MKLQYIHSTQITNGQHHNSPISDHNEVEQLHYLLPDRMCLFIEYLL